MTEKDRLVRVDFNKVKVDILARANEKGPMGDIHSWKKAFPEIEFPETDEVFTGQDFEWSRRTPNELAFYVAFMKNPSAVNIDYEISVDDVVVKENENMTGSIWLMWLEGCFSGEEKLDFCAYKMMLWLAADSEETKRTVYDIDYDSVKLLSLKIEVAPV